MRYVAFLFLLISITGYSQALSKEELLGQFDPSTHPDFVRIDSKYTSKHNIYLRQEVYEAYERMFEEAWKVGINLQILSATRNFDYQRGIWERKWDRPRYMGWEDIDKAVDIMTYSSMPGTSRHHWGTDIDLCSLRNDWFASAEGARVYDWLNLNAWKYGFRQVYSNKEITVRTGYNEEKWHWSYMPLSSVFLDQYNALVLEEDIEGFLGSEVAGEIGVITDYVNGVED